MRTIKSFVMRAGRTSPRQQQGLECWLKNYALPLDKESGDLAAVFGRVADTIVEIGFGMGASLLATAIQNPDKNYIGIEVHRAGLGSFAHDLHSHQLTNVRLVPSDAVEIFKTRFVDNSLAGVQIFFPDPWPKKRHHKRRLIQTEFIALLARKIRPGGFLHCATDWEEYAEHMLTVLSAEPALNNEQKDGGYAPRPESRPVTKFERRGLGLGHGVWDLIFIKRD